MLKICIYSFLLFISLTSFVKATIVEFQTSQGVIKVNLFDQTTPKTVANFLQYIDEEHYTNSIIHRSVPGFIVQGGGFTFDGNWPLSRIQTNPSIINEPIYSNLEGTIAMAKLPGNPNSATDQWFFNLKNNASNLDVGEGGYTVFGQIIGDGMAIIEKIAQLTICDASNLGSPASIPMVIDDGQQCADLTVPGIENFVVINKIEILDSSDVTDADLNPVRNTLLTLPVDPIPTPDSNSGGGAFTWLTICCLMSFSMRKLVIKS